MLIRNQRQTARRGAAVVETAAVVSVFLLLLFGLVEFSRLIFIDQLVTTAAREGARYAVVNTDDPNLEANVDKEVRRVMGSMDGQVKNFKVQTYMADAAGNKSGDAND